jgi:hypothetical protein
MFSDWHWGDPLSDTKLIKHRIDYITNTPHAYVVCVGDLADCAILGSKGDVYGAVKTPGQQIDELVELLTPVKDKILAWVEGNHCARIYRSVGIWINKQVAAQLGKLDVYDPIAVQLDISVGCLSRRTSEMRPARYKGYITHGSGGGSTVGAKANRSESLKNITLCDFYISGHTHQPMVFAGDCLRDGKQLTQLFVTAGATLKYGGYAASGGYRPASTMNPYLILDGTIQKMSTAMCK